MNFIQTKNGFNLNGASTNEEQVFLRTLHEFEERGKPIEFRITNQSSEDHPHISFDLIIPYGVTVDEFGFVTDTSHDCQICGLPGGH